MQHATVARVPSFVCKGNSALISHILKCTEVSKSDRKEAETIAQQEGLAYEGRLADLHASKPGQGQKSEKIVQSCGSFLADNLLSVQSLVLNWD